jgi:hypothetical protein
MSSFDPLFAHDTLLLLAEAAYVSDPNQLSLPPAYSSVVGQITVNRTMLSPLAAASSRNVRLLASVESAGSFGWVIQNVQEQTVVVAFRGTVDLQDWLKDLDFLPEAYGPVANYGTVHQGFQLVYRALADSLRDLLQKTKGQCRRLILTGHSLGAALSELAAPDLLHNMDLGVVPEVQNFAGPRVGHADFAGVFDVEIDTCFRVVNLWDIVPQVPPSLALFEHVGLAVKVDGGFTVDELVAHSLERSYGPGLEKLQPQPGGQAKPVAAAATAAFGFPNEMLIGREP